MLIILVTFEWNGPFVQKHNIMFTNLTINNMCVIFSIHLILILIFLLFFYSNSQLGLNFPLVVNYLIGKDVNSHVIEHPTK